MNTLEIITAISTAASAIFAAGVLLESIKLRKPCIAVRLCFEADARWILQIMNIGGGTAYDVSVFFEKPISNDPKSVDYFKSIPFIEPGGSIQYRFKMRSKEFYDSLMGVKSVATWKSFESVHYPKFLYNRFCVKLNPITVSRFLDLEKEEFPLPKINSFEVNI